MYVCMYAYMCTCINACMHVYVCMSICICLWFHKYCQKPPKLSFEIDFLVNIFPSCYQPPIQVFMLGEGHHGPREHLRVKPISHGNFEVKPLHVITTFSSVTFLKHLNFGALYHLIWVNWLYSTNHVGTHGIALRHIGVMQLLCGD